MESTWRTQAVCTLEYGPLNQPITAHVVHERYNKKIDEIAMGFVTIQKITPFQGTNTLDIRIVQDAPAQFEQARYAWGQGSRNCFIMATRKRARQAEVFYRNHKQSFRLKAETIRPKIPEKKG